MSMPQFLINLSLPDAPHAPQQFPKRKWGRTRPIQLRRIQFPFWPGK